MPASATLLPDSTTSAIPLAKATLSATRFILFSTLIFIHFRTHRPGDWRRSPVGGNACSQITDAVATPTGVSTEIISKKTVDVQVPADSGLAGRSHHLGGSGEPGARKTEQDLTSGADLTLGT